MKFNNINVLKDSRVNGYSISTVVTIAEYLDWFIEYGLPNKLEDQRPVLILNTNFLRQTQRLKKKFLHRVSPELIKSTGSLNKAGF